VNGKGSRAPTGFGGVTRGTVGRKRQSGVVRVGGLVVVGLVTTFAGIRCVVVIAVVTGCTIVGDVLMRPGERVNGAMVKSRGCPTVFIVADVAIGRELQGNVIGVGRLVVIVLVAPIAGIRCVVVIPVVAGCTIVGDAGMRPNQSEEIIVVSEGSRHPVWLRGVACGTVRREAQCRVVGIGRLVEIVMMTPDTGIRGIVVIAAVAGCAVVGNISMRAIQHKIAVVVSKAGGAPARLGGVAALAIGRKPQTGVAGIGRLVVVGGMAGGAIRWCALVTRRMAIDTIKRCMCSRQRECRAVVVENQVSITRRVTSQTGGAVERVAIHTIVLVVCLGVGMAGDASEDRIIRRVRVAINTLTPFSLVLTTVNGEILAIVVKGRWHPGIFIMAARTICGELKRCMVGVRGLAEIIRMAPVAGARRNIVVPVVTGSAVVGDGGMCAIESIGIVVIGKRGRVPVGLRRMARCAIG
jgi:hypothetical protein